MSDDQSWAAGPAELAAPSSEGQSAGETAQGAPTPEERVAETQPDDPDVGSDGTGLGELP